ADLGHVVSIAHEECLPFRRDLHRGPSAITTATAAPASWLRDRCHRATPSRLAAAATVPRVSSDGRPPCSRTTSASVHRSPTGAPRALATASLAAKQAASELTSRPRSPS